MSTATTHYLRHRRNLRRREALATFGWLLTRLTIYASSAMIVICSLIALKTMFQ